MRALVLAVSLLSLTAIEPAFAQRASGDGQSRVWFWEDAYSYGWSDTIDPRYLNDPPKVIKKARVTITEICARLVGRQMRYDQSARVVSTQQEDYCIRNGGKL